MRCNGREWLDPIRETGYITDLVEIHFDGFKFKFRIKAIHLNLNLILISLTFFVCIGNDEDGFKFRLAKGNKFYFNLILIYLYWLYHFKCIGEDDEGIKFGIFPAFHLGLKTTWLFVRDGDIGTSLSRPLCFTSEC